jgi:predicted nucleic acid-binding protein
MKEGRFFVDTNIFVYAYDISAGEKHNKAKEILKDLWSRGHGITSTQVLQELFVTLTRKIAKPIDVITAREIVKDFLKWKIVIVDGDIILEAIDIHREHRYSFWDSVIVAAAVQGGAGTVLSEDLSDKHKIKGTVIRDPFK